MVDHIESHLLNKCHICNARNVLIIEEFNSLTQVTSDCRPWTERNKLGICRSCGFVQKITDDLFMHNCEEIYRTYNVYYQAGGKEQKVFEQSKGLSRSRSESIIFKLNQQDLLPEKGTLLDIGCGNGNLLTSFSRFYPAWNLSGLEFDEQQRSCIDKIDNVRAFYSCELSDIEEKFDMISMIHCLEHIADPASFLKIILNKLTPGGLLLIELPAYMLNPFDLVITDHCTHFDKGNIINLLISCGFEIILASSEIVPKEFTILAHKNSIPSKPLFISESAFEDSHREIMTSIAWLNENIACASRIADHDELGIFGTSISGVWLYNEIPDQISFFVDEDKDRINKKFLGRPVYHPENLPDKGSVYIPLPYAVATVIAERLKIYGDRFFTPPPI